MKNNSHLSFNVAVLGLVSAAFLVGCNKADSRPHGGMPPPEVNVVTLEAKSVPITFEYTGQTAGSREVEVRARVTGIIKTRNYREGGRVVAGQSLFTIDPAPFEAAMARAEADVAAAQARVEQMRRNAARMKPLFEAKAVSQKEYDDATSGEAVAEADLKAANARLTEAKLNSAYSRVESPITGVAGRAQRSEGNYVSGPDVLLTSVTQVNPMHVLFGISDEERLRLNQEVLAGRLILPKNNAFSVDIKLAEGGAYAHSGKLNFTDVRISGTTGTSEARAELPNPDGSLHPGQFVRVILKGAQRPNAVFVPQRAVLEGPKGKFVYVIGAEGKAEVRPVTLGEWYENNWIVTSGVSNGDKVIVDGLMKVQPGAPVQIAGQNAAPPAAGQGAAAQSAPKEDASAPPAKEKGKAPAKATNAKN